MSEAGAAGRTPTSSDASLDTPVPDTRRPLGTDASARALVVASSARASRDAQTSQQTAARPATGRSRSAALLSPLLLAFLLLLIPGQSALASCSQPSASSVVVQSGQTLDSIAQTYYGDEACVAIIEQANGLSSPSDVYAGENLVLAAEPQPAPSSNPHYSYGITSASQPATQVPAATATAAAAPSPVDTSALADGFVYNATGFAWPVKGPITQPFGVPELGVGSPHTGIDIGEPQGLPIRAAEDGRVTFAGGDPSDGLGYWVEINHGNRYATRYGHMMRPPIVLTGDYVHQGQIIGFIGTTGFSTGPHLHFEIRLDGNPIDPMLLLPHS